MFGGRHATGRVSDVYIYDFHKSVRTTYIDLYNIIILNLFTQLLLCYS